MPSSPKSITELVSQLKSTSNNKVVKLSGKQDLNLAEIIAVTKSNNQVKLQLSSAVVNRQKTILSKLSKQIADKTPIYGVTSAYGGQAKRLSFKDQDNQVYDKSKELSNSIIHVDVSTGPTIPTEITRAAMLIRLNMLLPGYSAVRLKTLEKLSQLINHNLTPQVGFYGTLGASGDLAHNGRVLAVLLHLPSAKVSTQDGRSIPANQALQEAGIDKLELEPKEGLALVNGDNFSTAAALIQTYESIKLMQINLVVAAITIQALKGSTRNFHPLLHQLRPHPGQTYTSTTLTKLLENSQLAYQEMKSHQQRAQGELIQDPYSIRCLPQYFGSDWETLLQIWHTISINANSVSDNPLWTTPETITPGEEPYQWVSGGNFLAMHMSEALDKLRKILIHIVKQNDRHLARLINPQQNNGLPPNLSDPKDISQCTFKGLQTQMGMYEVYASSLATPISTAFGVHEELNQDLTSHAMTSAIYNQEVIRLTKLAVATNLIAACQAIDLRGGPDLLSPSTQPLYHWLRQHTPYIDTTQPLGHHVELIADNLSKENLNKIIFSGD